MGTEGKDGLKEMANIGDLVEKPKTEAIKTTTIDPTKFQKAQTVSAAVKIREAVAAEIAGSTQKVTDIVVNTMVEETVNKRAAALTKALDTLKQAKGELNKMKPDVVAYDDEGNAVSSNWTKQALEAKKKAAERVKKISKIIDSALAEGATNNDWGKLSEVK